MTNPPVVQIGTLRDALAFLEPTGVLLLVVLFALYQVYSPNFLPETKFQTITNEFRDQIDGIEDRMTSKLDKFGEKQTAHIQITRAIASVENPSEEIDDAIVDDYLLQNGVDKDDFLRPRESTKDHVIDEGGRTLRDSTNPSSSTNHTDDKDD